MPDSEATATSAASEADAPVTSAAPSTTQPEPPDLGDVLPAGHEPSLDNRHPQSAFGPEIYYDHAAIRRLFPECPPPPEAYLTSDFARRFFDYWGRTWANWDATFIVSEGERVAAGWLNDEQIELWLPGGGVTKETALDAFQFDPELDTVTIWWNPPETDPNGFDQFPYIDDDGTYAFKELYQRAAKQGYLRDYSSGEIGTTADILTHFRDDGMTGVEPWPLDVAGSFDSVLVYWMYTRYGFPPTVREPAAWAMRTLIFEARDVNCVADMMLNAVCPNPPPETGLLSWGTPFGRALWSLVCPERTVGMTRS